MFLRRKLSLFIRSLLLVFAFGTLVELVAASDAFARAGGGRRSSGRPAPSSERYSQPTQPYNQPQAQPPRSGGFMRGLAGGLAGGFLGSMLFSSLGHAGSGTHGGGIGLLEILLLAGIGYLLYRYWKNKRMHPATAGGPISSSHTNWSKQWSSPESSSTSASPAAFGSGGLQSGAFARSLNSAPALTTEEASDIFFRIQGAWTRRDLSSVRSLLGSDIARSFEDDLSQLQRERKINRLENISIRQVDVLQSWQELGEDLARVRFRANLLDYTVDETSGQVLEGSDREPVKFEEDWIFARPSQSQDSWKLVGIQQA